MKIQFNFALPAKRSLSRFPQVQIHRKKELTIPNICAILSLQERMFFLVKCYWNTILEYLSALPSSADIYRKEGAAKP